MISYALFIVGSLCFMGSTHHALIGDEPKWLQRIGAATFILGSVIAMVQL